MRTTQNRTSKMKMMMLLDGAIADCIRRPVQLGRLGLTMKCVGLLALMLSSVGLAAVAVKTL